MTTGDPKRRELVALRDEAVRYRGSANTDEWRHYWLGRETAFTAALEVVTGGSVTS